MNPMTIWGGKKGYISKLKWNTSMFSKCGVGIDRSWVQLSSLLVSRFSFIKNGSARANLSIYQHPGNITGALVKKVMTLLLTHSFICPAAQELISPITPCPPRRAPVPSFPRPFLQVPSADIYIWQRHQPRWFMGSTFRSLLLSKPIEGSTCAGSCTAAPFSSPLMRAAGFER